FDRFGIKTTWFVPGHSIETFPEEIGKVVAAGHEIGIHGYSHENPIAMTRVQEEAILDKCIELAQKLTGHRPTGYVAPWWEFSPVTNELLLERGFKYDHSLMHQDFQPHYVRVGDRWTKIDYAKHPSAWMKPLVRGEETDLIEIPASWYLDDLPADANADPHLGDGPGARLSAALSPGVHVCVMRGARARATLDRSVAAGRPRRGRGRVVAPKP